MILGRVYIIENRLCGNALKNFSNFSNYKLFIKRFRKNPETQERYLLKLKNDLAETNLTKDDIFRKIFKNQSLQKNARHTKGKE